MNQRLLTLLWATTFVVASAFAAACSEDDASAIESPAKGITEVTRQVLQSGTSETAPGQLIELQRVIIPAGAEIASHTHPGPQLAVIVEGTLTYTVIRGQAQLSRASSAVETIQGGRTVEVRTGDSLAEPPGMVHSAKNSGKTPVVIYLSSLFPAGAPASSPAQ